MKTKICVTQEDIDNGICRDHNSCPVALALKRSLKNVLEVHVGGAKAGWVSGHYNKDKGFEAFMYECVFPEQISNFIAMFDNGVSVGPIEFELEEEYND